MLPNRGGASLTGKRSQSHRHPARAQASRLQPVRQREHLPQPKGLEPPEHAPKGVRAALELRNRLPEDHSHRLQGDCGLRRLLQARSHADHRRLARQAHNSEEPVRAEEHQEHLRLGKRKLLPRHSEQTLKANFAAPDNQPVGTLQVGTSLQARATLQAGAAPQQGRQRRLHQLLRPQADAGTVPEQYPVHEDPRPRKPCQRAENDAFLM